MRYAKVALLLAAALALVACSKLTLENYGKLKVGQGFSEVTAIIGEPARCDEALGVRKCQWGDAQQGVGAVFVADRALELHANNLK